VKRNGNTNILRQLENSISFNDINDIELLERHNILQMCNYKIKYKQYICDLKKYKLYGKRD